jgi:hypothetical protein
MRTLELTLSSENIKDQLETFLRAMSVINDNENVNIVWDLPPEVPIKVQVWELKTLNHGT